MNNQYPMTVKLGALVQANQPSQLLLLLLLFLALLRKWGLLPPNPNDDQYTSLGFTAGFEKAQKDAIATLMMRPISMVEKTDIQSDINKARTAYQSGTVDVSIPS